MQSIHSPRYPTEQGQLLCSGGARGDALKGIPQRGPVHPHLFHTARLTEDAPACISTIVWSMRAAGHGTGRPRYRDLSSLDDDLPRGYTPWVAVHA